MEKERSEKRGGNPRERAGERHESEAGAGSAARRGGRQRDGRSGGRVSGTDRQSNAARPHGAEPVDEASRAASSARKRRQGRGGGGRWTRRDFVLQLSVVILGVMVTFIGSGLVSRWQEKRKAQQVMHLVYRELETNRAAIEQICRSLNHDRRGMLLLQENGMDYRSLPLDSLVKYQFILGQIRDFRPNADALEVLRSSGAMTAVGDRQLLFEVLGCYSWMDRFAVSVDGYNRQKLKAIDHLFENGSAILGGPDPEESWRTMLDDPLCSAFFGTMAYYFAPELLEGGAVARIDSLREALDRAYRFE